MFSHEKGAFTGAITARHGRFAMAEGGTLFLDEIGEMTMAMQVKLLKVLEECVFERVGSTDSITANVRIIAATNRNLEEMLNQGKFREDLYFRLDVFPIRLPTLAEPIEDLPLLIDELITRLEHRSSSSVRFTDEAMLHYPSMTGQEMYVNWQTRSKGWPSSIQTDWFIPTICQIESSHKSPRTLHLDLRSMMSVQR